MKIRTIYFKVRDMERAAAFWEAFLGVAAHKRFDRWTECMAGNVRLGLLLDESGEEIGGCTCVPVFEFADEEAAAYVERAKALGARVIEEGLDNPELRSVVLADPFGNEFEVSRFHD